MQIKKLCILAFALLLSLSCLASSWPNKYDFQIYKAARTYLPNTDWRLYKAQLIQESALKPNATSHAGAKGLAQFMPGTWQDIQTQLNAKLNSADIGTDYAPIAGGSTIVTVGNLISGSISTGFGPIDVITDITTTAKITGGNIILDGSVIGHSSDTDLITLSSEKVTVAGAIQASSIILGTTPVTANASELNQLSGLSVGSAKLNYTTDVTSNIQAQLSTKLDITIAGDTYGLKAGSGDITTVGALAAGSIGGSFGVISTDSNISTTTNLTGGTLNTNNIVIGSSTIGYTGDTGLITLSNGLVNIAGELQVSTLDIGGTNVTALAADLNKLTGLNTTNSELEHVHGVTSNIQTQLNSKLISGPKT